MIDKASSKFVPFLCRNDLQVTNVTIYIVLLFLSTVVKKLPLNYSQKRTPITFETNGAGGKKAHKEDRSLYHPPSGKFSEKAGTFQPGNDTNGYNAIWSMINSKTKIYMEMLKE